MHHHRTLIAVIVLGFALATGSSINGAKFQIQDYETVYGVLDAAGAPKEVTVVDWLRVLGDGETTVVDPGDLTKVRNVKGPERPRVVKGGLAWDVKCRDGIGDIFYSGYTDRSLPVEIGITYTLNGKKVPSSAVGGASGDLVVDITMTNRLESSAKITYQGAQGENLSSTEKFTVPLVVIVNLEVPSDKFQRIEAPDATTYVSGSTVNVNWIVFPYPSAKIRLHLVGKNIGLEPINFIVAPKMPPLTQVDMRAQLAELLQGTGQLDNGLVTIAGGLDQIIAGHTRMTAGVSALETGVDNLIQLNAGHREIVEKALAGIDEVDTGDLSFSLDGFDELDSGLEQMGNGLSDLIMLNSGHQLLVKTIQDELDNMDIDALRSNLGAVEQMGQEMSMSDQYLERAVNSYSSQEELARSAREQHDQIQSLIRRLARANSSMQDDPNYQKLLDLLDEQDKDLNSLVNGGRQEDKSFDGMSYTSRVLEGMLNSVRDGMDSITALSEAGGAAGTMGEAIDRLKQALQVLAQGGTLEGTEIPGLDTTGQGLSSIKDGVDTIRTEVGNAQKQVEEKAGVLKGIADTVKNGLDRLKLALNVLLNGGEIEGQKVPGLDTAASGLDQVAQGLRELGQGVAISQDGLEQVKSGALEARDKGTQPMQSELTDAMNELNRTGALEKAIEGKVDSYDCFIGKPSGSTSEVRFLLRTDRLR